MKTHELFKSFRPVSAREWKLALQAGLRGGDYNDLLTSTSPEGIHIKPFYTREDLPDGGPTPSTGPDTWQIGCLLDPQGPQPGQQAAQALEGGVDAWVADLPAEPKGWPEWLMAQKAWPDSVWLAAINPQGLDWAHPPQEPPSKTIILADPIGQLAASGNWVRGMEADLEGLPAAAAAATRAGLSLRLQVRADIYQQAGANAVQELAYALAHAHEYVGRAEGKPAWSGWSEEPVFRVAIGGDYFTDIAKLRALRRGWSLLAESYGLPGRCQILALPSLRNKTLYDYNTNMLRTTLECMAAVIGGADLVCNRPYDVLYHLPNEFADRIARNQLLLLRHEAYLNRVANAADGAFYIESLTDELGCKALELLKSLEQGGGLLAQLKAHTLQKKIRQSADREQEAFDAGRRVLVGSNRYPNPTDRMGHEMQRPTPVRAGRKTLLEPLPLRRLAEAYEKNRLQHESR